MADTNDLLKDVCASFLDAYEHNPQASSESIIAFEEVGIIPGLTAGNTTSAAVAVEFASLLADALPDISGGVYVRTTRTLSLNYDNLLESSVSNSQAPAAIFNATKAAARQAYDNSILGSESGITSFQPVSAAPANWYDATQQTNWLHYSYSSDTPASPPTPPPASGTPVASAPPVHIIAPMEPWRLTAVPPAAEEIHRAPVGVIDRAPSGIRTYKPLVQTAQLARTTAVAVPSPDMVNGARLLKFAFPIRSGVVAITPTPAPLQPAFTMAFDYCVVQLTRTWLSGDFMALPGWYVPGSPQGGYSSGPAPITSALASAAGTSSPAAAAYGPLTFIPTAFVAIKNLNINASALPGASGSTGPGASFGPFSLVNATGQANALSAPGIQIIGWICSAQPLLPPLTDPALIPMPVATPASTAVSAAAAS